MIEDSVVELVSLYQALEVLPRVQRSAVVLRYLGGMTAHETGEVLGLSRHQVHRLSSKAIEQLREQLQVAA